MTRNKIIKKSIVTLAAAAVLFPTYVFAADNKPDEQVDVCKCTCSYKAKVGGALISMTIAIKGRACRAGENGEECTFTTFVPPKTGKKSGCKTTTGNPRIHKFINKFQSPGGVLAPTKDKPSTTGTIMNTVPMKQYKMAPTKQK